MPLPKIISKFFFSKKSHFHFSKIISKVKNQKVSHRDQPACTTWPCWLAAILPHVNVFDLKEILKKRGKKGVTNGIIFVSYILCITIDLIDGVSPMYIRLEKATS